jgi:hypothetical protein
MTIVAQAEAGQTTVRYVGEGCEQESLDAFWEGLMAEQLTGVEVWIMAAPGGFTIRIQSWFIGSVILRCSGMPRPSIGL